MIGFLLAMLLAQADGGVDFATAMRDPALRTRAACEALARSGKGYRMPHGVTACPGVSRFGVALAAAKDVEPRGAHARVHPRSSSLPGNGDRPPQVPERGASLAEGF